MKHIQCKVITFTIDYNDDDYVTDILNEELGKGWQILSCSTINTSVIYTLVR